MQVNILLFPQVVPLDLVGPYEVLSRVPEWRVDIVAQKTGATPTDKPMFLLPTACWETAAKPDLLIVPGGSGVDAAISDTDYVRYVAKEAARSSYVLGVCTGCLLLGAAGILRGKKATSHWMVRHLLPALGATAVDERVLRDGNVFTAAGVTAGIDAALRIVGELAGAERAQAIQLAMEYDPVPPYAGGSVANTPDPIINLVHQSSEGKRDRRECLVAAAAKRLENET